MPGGWVTDQEWGFAVEHDGRYAATVTLRNEGERRAEIAYGSHPRIRGTRRHGTRAAAAPRLGLRRRPAGRGLHTVVWWANRGNWPSRRLAWRLGFTIDATLRAWLPQRGELLDAWGGTLLAGDERHPRHPWIDAPTIESPRLPLRLRRARTEDADRIVEACATRRRHGWLGEIPQPYGRADAEAFLLARPSGRRSARRSTWSSRRTGRRPAAGAGRALGHRSGVPQCRARLLGASRRPWPRCRHGGRAPRAPARAGARGRGRARAGAGDGARRRRQRGLARRLCAGRACGRSAPLGGRRGPRTASRTPSCGRRCRTTRGRDRYPSEASASLKVFDGRITAEAFASSGR